jgi:hypothetical protein
MRARTAALAAGFALLLSACATSHRARSVTPSAFLGDSASLLIRGEASDDTLLTYRRHGTDWRMYDKILLEPVAMWGADGAPLTDADARDFQLVIDNFQRQLVERLGKDYRIVNAPAAATLRLQTAILNGQRANAALKVAKNIAPFAGLADMVWTFATGKPAFVGEVSFEYMVRDAMSGDLLAAGADRRVGGTQITAATFTTWGDVRNILGYWSDLTAYRLCIDRSAGGCVKPRAGIAEP